MKAVISLALHEYLQGGQQQFFIIVFFSIRYQTLISDIDTFLLALLPRSRRRARSCFAFGLFFLNRAAVGWAVSCSAFGLFFFIFFFSFVGEQTQTPTRPIVITG